MRLLKAATVLLALLCIGTPAAQADVIDFRLDPWGPGGAGSETNGGVTVEALPPVLYWDSRDGFGVDSDSIRHNDREDDEINNREVLRVTFAGGTNLTGFLLTDLFFEGGIAERAFYSLNGGTTWTSVSAPSTNVSGSTNPQAANGEFWVNLAPVFVNTISFGFREDYVLQNHSDFAVGAVRVAAVPEPASLMMLTSGLVGAFLARRRRQATTS